MKYQNILMKIYIILGQAYAFIWQNNKKDFLFNGNNLKPTILSLIIIYKG